MWPLSNVMSNPAVITPPAIPSTEVGSPSAPPMLNVNLQVAGHLSKTKDKTERVVEPIIKILGIILFVSVGVVLMSHSILSTAIVEEVTRMLFLCALGLIIERGLGKKTRVQFGVYTLELGGI